MQQEFPAAVLGILDDGQVFEASMIAPHSCAEPRAMS